jgi:hypothetical protein
MYHLYSGSGKVSDSTGTKRAIQVTAMISDQLLDNNSQPVQVTPGQPLTGEKYHFKISDWHVAVDKIGTFFGQKGGIGIQLLNSRTIADIMWGFSSDVGVNYSWGGEIDSMEQPNKQDWPNPSASDFAHLPKKIRCSSGAMGSTIVNIFIYPQGSGTAYLVDFVLNRM